MDHYNPHQSTAVWTKDLPQRLIDDLRLHLSWDLGLRTFTWSREAIGTRIIHGFNPHPVTRRIIRPNKLLPRIIRPNVYLCCMDTKVM